MFRNKLNRQIAMITLSSYFFFFLASGWHVILLWISTTLDWNVGKKIKNSKDGIRKGWLILSLTCNLTLLGVFKYLDFIIESINFLSLSFWWAPKIDPYGILLPVGISFYTFQTMSYSIDIYRNKMEPYESVIDFAAYAAFFPQLVAGPIVRADDFLQEIKKPLKFNSVQLRIGISMILYGLVKKLVFADNFAAHADFIFLESQIIENTALIWWGSLCFGLQIYCDFSAYTDIALGSALILGIKLPENFDTPYISTSPQDFWRRWHISLSTWLRDYLYIPLGGSRNGKYKLILALMGTMFLGGLWHGASWNFALWGLVHGIILLIHRYFTTNKMIKFIFENSYTKYFSIIISWILTQYLIFMTWLIFRVEDTKLLLECLKSFIGYKSYFDLEEALNNLPEVKYITFILAITFMIIHPISSRVGRGRDYYANLNPMIWGITTAFILLSILWLRPAETAEFIYFRF